MGNFLHRTTKQYLTSVSPNSLPDPIANYIEEPDMSAVLGVEPSVLPKYWNIVGDIVSEMNQVEKDAVDAAELAAQVQPNRDFVTEEVDADWETSVRTRALIQLLNKRDNYHTNRISELQTQIQALQSAIVNTGGNVASLKSDVGALDLTPLATNTRTLPDAVNDYKADVDAGVSD